MREITTAQNHHNDLSFFTNYACPTIWGGDLDEFMFFCTDSICCAPTTAPLSDEPKSTTDGSDARSDLVDPEALHYQREMRAAASALEEEYDMISCCSSISSTGSMASGRERNRVRVFFDASLATTATTAEPVPPSTVQTRESGVKNQEQPSQNESHPEDNRNAGRVA